MDQGTENVLAALRNHESAMKDWFSVAQKVGLKRPETTVLFRKAAAAFFNYRNVLANERLKRLGKAGKSK